MSHNQREVYNKFRQMVEQRSMTDDGACTHYQLGFLQGFLSILSNIPEVAETMTSYVDSYHRNQATNTGNLV